MMRRTSWIPVALLALAMAGCESTDGVGFAQLRGLTDMEYVGRYIFVVSSHNSELRVMDSEADPALGRELPGFLRAPNPLALLSIPVLDRPLALAPDIHFTSEGEEVRGPYLYVQGSGAREISVVGAEPEVLREVARLSTGGPVTAITGVGPADADDPSTLIYAETVGGTARLYSVQLPELASLEEAALAPAPVRRLDGAPTTWPGQTIAALLTLPRAENGDLRVVVAFREESGAAGRTELVTLDPGGGAYTAAPVNLDFGGPVRALRTHPRVTRTEGEEDAEVTREILPAGARVFGALDEAACEVSTNCSGIVAVDAITLERDDLPSLTLGQRSLDIWGEPMTVLQTDGDLLVDFQLQPGLRRVPLRGVTVGQVMDLGGVMTTGGGYFTIFDAANMVLLNVSEDRPSIVTSSIGYYGADNVRIDLPLTGTISQLVSNQTTRLNHGVVQTEVISLVYRAPIPGMSNLEVGDEARVSLIPGGLLLANPVLAERLRVGDEVEAEGAAGCPETMVVDAFDAATGEVFTTPAPTDACSAVTFSAGEAQDPWVVTGSRSGWLGRAQEGEIFESVEGQPFARTEDYVAGAPQMRFNFVLPSVLEPSPGQRLRFETLDGFVPQQAQIKDARYQESLAFPPASAIVLKPASLDFSDGSIWAALPSYNQLVAFSPTQIQPNAQIPPGNIQRFQ